MKMNKKIIALFALVLALFAFSACGIEFGEKEYYEKDGLLYEAAEDGAAYILAGFVGEPELVNVPSEVDGIPVVAVGNSAFYNAEKLVSISLPDSIKKIDDYAFDNCYLLSEINLPRSVEFIGFNAFSDCGMLAELVLPEALTELDSSVFTRCTALKTLTFGKNIKKIGHDAFSSCEAISEVRISDLQAWCSIEFENHLSNPLCFAESLYVNGEEAKDIVIGGVEKINDYAFYKFSGIRSVTVQKGVKEIGVSVFSECEGLKSVTLEDGVANIGMSSFSFCSSLEEISFGKGLEFIGGLSFYECESLKRVSIVDLRQWCETHFYVDNSGTSNPLYYADELVINGNVSEHFVIPEGTKKISAIAFVNYQGIKTITLPKSIVEISDNAFFMCASIGRVIYRGSKEEWRAVTIGENNASFAYFAMWTVFQG